jgi:hypothetical protein
MLLLLAAVALAADLTPREGQGWSGFKAGTWLRLKRTVIQPGRMLTPTVTRFTLERADERTLTLVIKAENALGMAEDARQTVPAKGEAGPGEEEKVEELEGEVLVVAGRELACAVLRSTISGPAGKRVVTKWIGKEPKVVVKRFTTTYGPDGKKAAEESLLLKSLAEERPVGDRTLSCVKYATKREDGGLQWAGEAYLSREVPGGVVWSEEEVRKGAALVFTMRVEAIEFEAK